MTRKDYRIIARALFLHKTRFPAGDYEQLCYTMAAHLGGANANFVTDKFIAFCEKGM